jgi:hypothetical protein
VPPPGEPASGGAGWQESECRTTLKSKPLSGLLTKHPGPSTSHTQVHAHKLLVGNSTLTPATCRDETRSRSPRSPQDCGHAGPLLHCSPRLTALTNPPRPTQLPSTESLLRIRPRGLPSSDAPLSTLAPRPGGTPSPSSTTESRPQDCSRRLPMEEAPPMGAPAHCRPSEPGGACAERAARPRSLRSPSAPAQNRRGASGVRGR